MGSNDLCSAMQTKIRQQEDSIHEMEEQLDALTKERDKVGKKEESFLNIGLHNFLCVRTNKITTSFEINSKVWYKFIMIFIMIALEFYNEFELMIFIVCLLNLLDMYVVWLMSSILVDYPFVWDHTKRTGGDEQEADQDQQPAGAYHGGPGGDSPDPGDHGQGEGGAALPRQTARQLRELSVRRSLGGIYKL